MNKQALLKCLAELDKETPNLYYIKGILETVLDNEPVVTSSSQWQMYPDQPPYQITNSSTNINEPIELTDEEKREIEFARQYASGPVADLQ